MDIKSVGLGFNHVQSTAVPEDPVQDQSSKPQASEAQTAPNQPIETLNLEKNSRIGQMKLEGSLQQANLNMVLDAQPKAVPPSAKDVTNPANEGIVKSEDHLPQVIEDKFMDAVNAGIAKGRAEYLHDHQGGSGGTDPFQNAVKEQRLKEQMEEMNRQAMQQAINGMHM